MECKMDQKAWITGLVKCNITSVNKVYHNPYKMHTKSHRQTTWRCAHCSATCVWREHTKRKAAVPTEWRRDVHSQAMWFQQTKKEFHVGCSEIYKLLMPLLLHLTHSTHPTYLKSQNHTIGTASVIKLQNSFTEWYQLLVNWTSRCVRELKRQVMYQLEYLKEQDNDVTNLCFMP